MNNYLSKEDLAYIKGYKEGVEWAIKKMKEET
jgi:hypothetical protein